MARCAALYTHATDERAPRTAVELACDVLFLTFPDGRWHRVPLHGCWFETRDAACNQRFVRHLIIERTTDYARERTHLITPPDQGAIAPRAARLPGAPGEAAIVDRVQWDAVADWLGTRGRLGGRTLPELARLTCVATPQFAVMIGEFAAHVAVEMCWEQCPPMRGCGTLRNPLKPLQDAARTSPRARDALDTALATIELLRGRH